MCMRELLRTDKNWKYFLTPASTELPLMTMEETVRTLRKNGKDILEVYPIPDVDLYRLDEHPQPMRLSFPRVFKYEVLILEFCIGLDPTSTTY